MFGRKVARSCELASESGGAKRDESLEAIVAWFDAGDFRVPPLIVEGDPVDGPFPERKL